MKGAVKKFVAHCLVCQQAKPECVHAPGLLQPLSIPTAPWDMITMDFVEGLPVLGRYNCLLVIIDKLSNYGHFLPMHHPFTAQIVAKTFPGLNLSAPWYASLHCV